MIDEKKLIEEVEKHRLEYKDRDMGIGINVVKELIENQPKVNYPLSDCIGDCKNCWKTKLVNPYWISCKERLPEEVDGDFYPLMYVTNIFGVVRNGFYRVRDKQWYVYGEDLEEAEMVDNNQIIAWQDVPKPYLK